MNPTEALAERIRKHPYPWVMADNEDFRRVWSLACEACAQQVEKAALQSQLAEPVKGELSARDERFAAEPWEPVPTPPAPPAGEQVTKAIVAAAEEARSRVQDNRAAAPPPEPGESWRGSEMATDEQLARVRLIAADMSYPENYAALAAVLEDHAKLKRLADAVRTSLENECLLPVRIRHALAALDKAQPGTDQVTK